MKKKRERRKVRTLVKKKKNKKKVKSLSMTKRTNQLPKDYHKGNKIIFKISFLDYYEISISIMFKNHRSTQTKIKLKNNRAPKKVENKIKLKLKRTLNHNFQKSTRKNQNL